jgi:hypothetical protein
MKEDIFNGFMYYPVAPVSDKKALELTKTYFANAASPVSLKDLNKLINKVVSTDSGGLQAFRALKKGKIFIFGTLVKTRLNDPDVFILGIPGQCREYERMNSFLAMCIDLPTRTDDTGLIYWWKLSQSRKARDQMLALAKYICPETRLAIVLQPRNPMEVKNYFCFIFTPLVRRYAFPIRNFRNKPKDQLGNAYVLSFLHHMGIRHVHFLGSNAPPIIFLLAKALSLNMFDEASFDSRTWDQASISGYRYLNPETLSSVPTKNEGQLNPNENLRTVLRKYNGLFESALECFNPPDWVLVEEWLGICNIRLIERFKDMVLNIAMNNDLPYFIKQFPKYGKSKEMILEALDLLEESKEYGHDYIEQKYGAKIEELYA